MRATQTCPGKRSLLEIRALTDADDATLSSLILCELVRVNHQHSSYLEQAVSSHKLPDVGKVRRGCCQAMIKKRPLMCA